MFWPMSRGFGECPLAGIYTAMKQTEGETYTVISCDTPLVTRKTMAALEMKLTGNLDAVIPVCKNREQPLLAVYHKRVQDVLFDQLTQNKLKMTDTLKRLSVCYVQAEDIGAGRRSSLISTHGTITPDFWRMSSLQIKTDREETWYDGNKNARGQHRWKSAIRGRQDLSR